MASPDKSFTVGVDVDAANATSAFGSIAKAFAKDLATELRTELEKIHKELRSSGVEAFRQANPDVSLRVRKMVGEHSFTAVRQSQRAEDNQRLQEMVREENQARQAKMRVDRERVQRINERNRNLSASAVMHRGQTARGRVYTPGKAYEAIRQAEAAGLTPDIALFEQIVAADDMAKGGDPAAAKMKLASIGGQLESLQDQTTAARVAAAEQEEEAARAERLRRRRIKQDVKRYAKQVKDEKAAAIGVVKENLLAQKRAEQAQNEEDEVLFRAARERDNIVARHEDWLAPGRAMRGGEVKALLDKARKAGHTVPPVIEAALAHATLQSGAGDAAGANRTLLSVHEEIADLQLGVQKTVRENLKKEEDLAKEQKKERERAALGFVYGTRTFISGAGRALGTLTDDPWTTSMGGQAGVGMAGEAAKGISNWGAARIAATNTIGLGSGAALIGGAIASEAFGLISKLATRGAGIAKYATGVQSNWMATTAGLTGEGPNQYDTIMGNTVLNVARAMGAKPQFGVSRRARHASSSTLLSHWGFDPVLGDMGAQVQYHREQERLSSQMRAFANATGGNADEALAKISGAAQGARLGTNDLNDAFTVLRRQGLAKGGQGVGSMLAMRAFGAGGNIDAAASLLNRAARAFNLGPGGIEATQQMSAALTGNLLGLGATGDVTGQSAGAFASLGAAGVSMARVPGVTQSYLGDIGGARNMLGAGAVGKLRQSAIMLAALQRAGGDPLKAIGEAGNVSMDEQRSMMGTTFGSELSEAAWTAGGMSGAEARSYMGGKGQLPTEEMSMPKMGFLDSIESSIRNWGNVSKGAKSLGEIGSIERAGAALDQIAIKLDRIISGMGMGLPFMDQ